MHQHDLSGQKRLNHQRVSGPVPKRQQFEHDRFGHCHHPTCKTGGTLGPQHNWQRGDASLAIAVQGLEIVQFHDSVRASPLSTTGADGTAVVTTATPDSQGSVS